ncbi:hypothetical protein [Dactylosporangium sp. CA-092794]|uniref:hypothetical protein n=1 Tax=Dactylosporangium sp. CA-092794 TaxID=3239929 RepID=UPI003D8E1728
MASRTTNRPGVRQMSMSSQAWRGQHAGPQFVAVVVQQDVVVVRAAHGRRSPASVTW